MFYRNNRLQSKRESDKTRIVITQNNKTLWGGACCECLPVFFSSHWIKKKEKRGQGSQQPSERSAITQPLQINGSWTWANRQERLSSCFFFFFFGGTNLGRPDPDTQRSRGNLLFVPFVFSLSEIHCRDQQKKAQRDGESLCLFPSRCVCCLCDSFYIIKSDVKCANRYLIEESSDRLLPGSILTR